MLVHLDTDFAGDTDDACALGFLLGSPDLEIAAITTVADPDGRRAGYVRRFLELARRTDVPVAAGAGASLTTGRTMGGLPDHGRYWGGPPIEPLRPASGEAVALMKASVDRDATVIGVGPYTNLAVFERTHPGNLARVPVVLMGGWVSPSLDGLPPWGPEADWNVQCDTDAAMEVVAAAREPTLVTLPATLAAHLRESDLDRLTAAGPIGQLLARQGRAHRDEHSTRALANEHSGLPGDLLNFQYDPVACAVAVGWTGVVTETIVARPFVEEGVLRFARDSEGHVVRAVTEVDGVAFGELWLAAIENVTK